jgi:hypothetical protein
MSGIDLVLPDHGAAFDTKAGLAAGAENRCAPLLCTGEQA